MFRILFVIICFLSCTATRELRTPAQVKQMTTKQFNTSQDVIIKSIISLLQSESFMVQSVDKETGLIHAYKRVQNDRASSHRYWRGKSKDAYILKTMFYVEALNESLTEVKITFYEGLESSKVAYKGIVNKDHQEEMVYNSDMYREYFNKLRTEMERRKALLN
jgi:hypothetical protein